MVFTQKQRYLGIEDRDIAAVQVVAVEAVLGTGSLVRLVELRKGTHERRTNKWGEQLC